jgi:D-alanine-D-alanine ligase-like ATP-grasp enzyme
MSIIPVAKRSFPYLTRRIISLLEQGMLPNITDWYIDPDYGMITHLHYASGERRITYRNNPGINSVTASEVARDKGYTKTLLREGGFRVANGKEFLLPWWQHAIHLSEVDSIDRLSVTIATYCQEALGYPVYCKPIDGSEGRAIHRVTESSQWPAVLHEYESERIKLAVIEEAIPYPDFRIVIFNGRVISAYQRLPFSVTGNGSSTITELIAEKQEQFKRDERPTHLHPDDPRIHEELRLQNITIESVPAAGQAVRLLPISNLSAGGESRDVTDSIHPFWQDIAIRATAHCSLILCGVDLACPDITQQSDEYYILEMNAGPGLDHYAASGEEQKRRVDELYSLILNEPPIK